MIRVLVFLAIVVALAFAGVWLLERPGEIIMTVEGYRIETSLIAGVGVVVALATGVMVLWAVLRFLLRLPATISFASRARRRAKGYAAVSRGMVAVGAGDPKSARRHAEDAAKLLGEEPLTLLLRAQASQMAGDRNGAEGAFRRMLDEPETRVLGLRGLFVEARRKGDAAAARAYAAEASRLAPSVGWAGEALLEYQCADHDWTGALATLDRGAKGLDKAAVRRQRAVLLTAEGLDRMEREPDAALARLQEAVKLAPTLVPAVAALARLLSRRGEMRRASKAVEAAWAREPHPDLAEAYVSVRPGDSARDRMARAEKLLSLTPREPEARIAVANAAFSAREFDRVRSVLAPLLEGRPPVRVCLLMADLEEAENDASGAVREWLSRASRAPRDPAWIADGILADRWAPVSPATGRLDAFVWGTPVEQLHHDGSVEHERERASRARPVPLPVSLPLPTSDAVMADIDEAPAAVLVAPTPVEPDPISAPPPGPTAEPEPARPAAAAASVDDTPAVPLRIEAARVEAAKLELARTEPVKVELPSVDAASKQAKAEVSAPDESRPQSLVDTPAPVLKAAPVDPTPAAAPAAQAETAQPGLSGHGETSAPGKPRRGGAPSPVVFPLPTPPDMPASGPDHDTLYAGRRFLQ